MRLALWILAIIIGFTLGPRSWSAFKIAYYGWDKEYDKFAASVEDGCNTTTTLTPEPVAPSAKCKAFAECYRQGIEGVHT